MATDEVTIGDIAPIIEIGKSGVISLEIYSFGEFFDQIETLLKSFGQWNDEIAANMAIAREALEANPGLLDEGKQTVVEYLEWLVETYPPETPLSEIFGTGTGGEDEDEDETGGEDEDETGDEDEDETGDEDEDGTGDEDEDETGDEDEDGTGDEDEDEDGSGPTIIDGPGGLNIAVLLDLVASVQVDFDPGTGVVTVEGAGYRYTLTDVERLQFEDGTLAFDFDGVAGYAFRLYQAAFDREPDPAGIGYWIDILDADHLDLSEVAAHFLNSPEFESIFGSNLTIPEFVDALYSNTLGRDGDEEGVAFWNAALESGLAYSELLAAFAQSEEFAALIQSAMDDGIWYI